MFTRSCVHIYAAVHTVHIFAQISSPPLTCTSENFSLSLEVGSSKRLKSTYEATHPKHTHTHKPCRCIPTIIVRGTLLRKCCVCICSECVYSPERVIYFRNLPLSSSHRNGTLSTSEHNSPGLRGTGPGVRHVYVYFLPLIIYILHLLPLVLAICSFQYCNNVCVEGSCLRDRRRGRMSKKLPASISNGTLEILPMATVQTDKCLWLQKCNNDQEVNLVMRHGLLMHVGGPCLHTQTQSQSCPRCCVVTKLNCQYTSI